MVISRFPLSVLPQYRTEALRVRRPLISHYGTNPHTDRTQTKSFSCPSLANSLLPQQRLKATLSYVVVFNFWFWFTSDDLSQRGSI